MATVGSERETLRRKILELLKLLNGGSTKVSRYGLTVDVLNEFEGLMSRTDDAAIRKVLKVLRE